MLYVPATSAGWPGAGLANRGLQHMRAAIANGPPRSPGHGFWGRIWGLVQEPELCQRIM